MCLRDFAESNPRDRNDKKKTGINRIVKGPPRNDTAHRYCVRHKDIREITVSSRLEISTSRRAVGSRYGSCGPELLSFSQFFVII